MAYRYLTIAMLALAAMMSAAPACAASDDSRYTIMVPENGATPDKPEPWLPPKYKSPRGTPEHVVIPRSRAVPQPPRRRAAADRGAGNRPCAAEPADADRLRPQWRRDLPGSCRALRPSGRRLWPGRRQPERLYRQLHQSVARRHARCAGIHVLLLRREERRGGRDIGERSDAVLRTAMPGHDLESQISSITCA